MKVTAALMDKLALLLKGESLPASSLKGEWFDLMSSDGIIVAITKGSRKSYRARDYESLRKYLEAHFDIRDLETYRDMLKDRKIERSKQVKVTGNSKVRQQRTFCGFLVNCYDPLPATINGKPIEILPEEGTYIFIYDFRTFSLPEEVVIVGVENAENFRFIRRQRKFFKSYFPEGKQLVFVSRYPQEQSHDLLEWLSSIPNRYVHFGDLDLAGIHIFLTEYFRYLGEKASFLVPMDYESRILRGSRERYDTQYGRFGRMEIADSRLIPLVECIHRHHRGYDQEGFIE